MKKIKKVLAVVLCITVVAAMMLTGCGKKDSAESEQSYEGTWVAVKAESSGLEMGVSDIWEDGFTFELKKKGKLEAKVDKTSGKGSYEVKNHTITITLQDQEMTGTIKEDEFLIEDILGSGVSVLFAKKGTDAVTEGDISDFYEITDVDELDLSE